MKTLPDGEIDRGNENTWSRCQRQLEMLALQRTKLIWQHRRIEQGYAKVLAFSTVSAKKQKPFYLDTSRR